MSKHPLNLSPKQLALLRALKRNSGLQAKPLITARVEHQNIPLSFAQEWMWLLEEIASPAYNNPFTLNLSGRLDRDVLERSLNKIIQRHEILRATFVFQEQLVQAILPLEKYSLPILDLSRVPEANKQTSALNVIHRETSQPFELSQEYPFRIILLKLSETEHWLHWTLHHIVTDDASFAIILKELADLYRLDLTHSPASLPSLPLQYGDYACWQRNQSAIFERELTYWQLQLQNLPPTLNLPTRRQMTASQSLSGQRRTFLLSPQLTQSLLSFSQQAQVTLFTTLLTAFHVLLYRYTQQDDVIIGVPVSLRHRADLQDLIGVFINTLLIRSQPKRELSFRSLLQQVQQTVIDARLHQELPFHKLLEHLHPGNIHGRASIPQVVFDFQQNELPEIQLSGLAILPIEIDPHIAKADLTLHITQASEQLIGYFEYRLDLFESDAIERMVGHFQTLLEGIVANPEQSIATLPLLTEQEQHRLLVEWNDTQVNYPQDQCIQHLFEEQVEKTPDAVAVVFEAQSITYRKLNARANQLAHYLQSLGVGPDVLVGICVDRSIEMMVGLLGILKAGGAYVPIDPAYPPERQAYMLQDSQVAVLLTQAALAPTLPASQAHVIFLDAHWSDIADEKTTNPKCDVKLDELAYVIYTSGSTGKPKGVLVPHRGLSNCLTAMRSSFGLIDQDCWLAVSSISFDVAALELYSPLIAGARLVLASRRIAADGYQLKTLLNDTAATFMVATPVTYHMLLASGWEPNAALAILCGGEALSQDLAAQLLPKAASLWNLYGPTETTIFSTSCKVGSADAPITIGYPIANTQLYILDSHLQPVSIGVPGELHIGGIGLARGYLNHPELTAERFVPNPFTDEPGARLYKTGDLARFLTNGQVEYLGRTDQQIKIRGFRIELGEVEAVLSQHPAIQHCVVAAREDKPGDKRLVAYWVAAEAEVPTSNELRQFLQQTLPDYMIPVAFIQLATLPLTPNGKVDRRALPQPDLSALHSSSNYIAPRTPLEQQLADIWAEVLQLEQVGIHDNFFELGGHSLLATQVVTRIQTICQINVPLRSLFEALTIERLAKYIEAIQYVQITQVPQLTVLTEGQEEVEF